MTCRPATIEVCALPTRLNHQFIRDERYRDPMTVAGLEQRMQIALVWWLLDES